MATSTKDTTSTEILTVNRTTFQNLVLDATGKTVVEFMSYGCSHCRIIEPVVQEVARTLAAKVKFYRVNVAVDADLEERYGIEGTPTFVMFENGSEVGRTEGPPPTILGLTAAIAESFAS
jgi:thiol-disulfide isomerase/thioredoxin